MPPELPLERRSSVPYERVPAAPTDDDSELSADEDEKGGKGWAKRLWQYLPLCFLLVLIFAPHYSILTVFVDYFLRVQSAPILFIFHLSVIYLLTFLTCCSLIVCIARDPGPVHARGDENQQMELDALLGAENGDREVGMQEALSMVPPPIDGTKDSEEDDFNSPRKWCRKCWAPKPERAHHCSICKRCVLKMDHHCPWLANKCVGHWTYTAFLHFLLCITLLSTYVSIVTGGIVYKAIIDLTLINDDIAVCALFLTVYCASFSLTTGSFFVWHVYIATTNQSTLESMSPFLLLRYLPKAPSMDAPDSDAGRPGDEPASKPFTTQENGIGQQYSEQQLSSTQRRHVRNAHQRIRLYDVGWRENWRQLIGIGRRRRWYELVVRILCGGAGYGDGRSFPRNPRADGLLARLAADLANEAKTD